MDLESQIRTFIKSRRISMGFSQRDMAELMFIDERNYARLERGERKGLEIYLLQRAAVALKMSLVEIIKGSEEMNLGNSEIQVFDFHDVMLLKLKQIAEDQKEIRENTDRILQEAKFRK